MLLDVVARLGGKSCLCGLITVSQRSGRKVIISQVSVCHSAQVERGSHVTISHDALDLPICHPPVQGLSPLCTGFCPLLVTSGKEDWTPVQTCSLEDLTGPPQLVLTSGG